ncbi:hypothetical protein [Nocardia cyriacigeorgica]|uniref:hypothetical protein n=1 Tax=Nocardia cyriacigeorgica TaxID=135487 RepID=UPI002456C692|nr:hypothetical protein [Nocardia cyriacigeorgica]
MAEADINFGQAQIAAFNAAARSGVVRYEPEVAQQAAAEYGRVVNELLAIREKLAEATRPAGFGGLESGKQLQQGFATKAIDGVDVLNKLAVGAMQLQEAYLRAGNLLEDADAQNAVTMRFMADTASEGPQR